MLEIGEASLGVLCGVAFVRTFLDTQSQVLVHAGFVCGMLALGCGLICRMLFCGVVGFSRGMPGFCGGLGFACRMLVRVHGSFVMFARGVITLHGVVLAVGHFVTFVRSRRAGSPLVLRIAFVAIPDLSGVAVIG